MANLLENKRLKAEYDKAYRAKNKERISLRMKSYYLTLTEEQKTRRKEYRDANKSRLKSYHEQYRNINKEKVLTTIRNWYTLNRDKKQTKANEWRQANRGVVNFIAAKRRALQIKATPKWADLNAIKEFYKNCPEGYHVDHVIPLQNKYVCGLHVINNLQYLPALENIRKRNKYELT